MMLRSFAFIIAGLAVVQTVSAQTSAINQELPYGELKICENANSGCNTKVSLQCRYTNIDGVIDNCMDPALRENQPFLTLTTEECSARRSVDAVITYRMCNENDIVFNPRRDINNIRWRKNNSVKPDSWDDPMEPNTCREFVLDEKIDLCKETRVIDVEMDGVLAKAWPNYCRCYLFKESNLNILYPSASPSYSPTLSPSAKPIKAITDSPTRDPSSRPSERPVVACAYSEILITEIASPPNQNGRFIELYFPEGCQGSTINRDIQVVRWGDNQNPINLRGLRIPDDRFLVLCKSANANSIYGSGTCDYIGTENDSPANVGGTDTIAVIDGSPNNVIDIYGVPFRPDPQGTDQDFTDGRAARNRGTDPEPDPTSSAYWKPNEWTLTVPVDDNDNYDPRKWENSRDIIIIPITNSTCIFTELSDPVDNYDAGFVEIQCTDPGEALPDGLKVVTYKSPKERKIISPDVDTIPLDSFIIICRNRVVFEEVYGKVCEIEDPGVHPDGRYPIALKDGDNNILDIYGYPDQGFGPGDVFVDGRAVKKIEYPEPSPFYIPFTWDVLPGAGSETATVNDMTPRSWEPNNEDRDPLILFFTEFADPSDGRDKRFIELYSPNKRNYVITEQLVIIQYDRFYNIQGYRSLQGSTIDANGFIVLCTAQSYSQCTSVVGYDTIVDSDGTFGYTLSSCSNPDNLGCQRIDTYGIGVDASSHNYSSGRAVRYRDATPRPYTVFDLNHWYIIPGSQGGTVDSGGCDPGEWVDPPADTGPAPSPVKAPSSKGKGTTMAPTKAKKGSNKRVRGRS